MGIAQQKVQQFQQLMDQGQLDHALLLANHLSIEQPEDWLGYSMVADAFKAKGDFQQAIKFYQFSLTKKPHEPRLLTVLGQWFRHLGDLSQAYQSYLQAIEVAPEDPFVLSDLGNFLIFAGEPDEARMAFEKALRLGEPNARLSLLDLTIYQYDRQQIETILSSYGKQFPLVKQPVYRYALKAYSQYRPQ